MSTSRASLQKSLKPRVLLLAVSVVLAFQLGRESERSAVLEKTTFSRGMDDAQCDVQQSAPSPNPSLPAARWLTEIDKHQWKVYSQRNQDGVLDFLFRSEVVGTTNKYFVEFGVNDINNEGSGSNTRFLSSHRGWTGLLLDQNNENPSINLHAHTLTPENIADTFALYDVPEAPDYVSVDVDSIDLWLFKAIASRYRPRVLTVEYNSNFACDNATTFRPGTGQGRVKASYGASFAALYLAGKETGYTIVFVIPSLDVVFVRSDILSAQGVADIETVLPYWETWPKYCSLSAHGGTAGITQEGWKVLMPYTSSETLPQKPPTMPEQKNA